MKSDAADLLLLDSAPPFDSIEAVLAVLGRGRSQRLPGSAVTCWEHALFTAALAAQAGASAALITAALLHDLGHLLPAPSLAGGRQAQDGFHELLAVDALAGLFDVDVTEPIRLHVQAKRYLVSTRSDYQARLSEASLRSLAAQGGPMRAQECELFRCLTFADDALRLRHWDDLATHRDMPPQRLERFLPALRYTLRSA